MRSKFNFFKKSKLQSWGWNFPFSWDWNLQWYWSGGQIFDHEIKTQKSIITNFNLMINLLAASAIMRLKAFMHRWLINTVKYLNSFDLTITFGANKSLMRLKFKKAFIANFQKKCTCFSFFLSVCLSFFQNGQIVFKRLATPCLVVRHLKHSTVF